MEKVISWRHDIHQNPELSNREYRTAKKIAVHLKSLGINISFSCLNLVVVTIFI